MKIFLNIIFSLTVFCELSFADSFKYNSNGLDEISFYARIASKEINGVSFPTWDRIKQISDSEKPALWNQFITNYNLIDPIRGQIPTQSQTGTMLAISKSSLISGEAEKIYVLWMSYPTNGIGYLSLSIDDLNKFTGIESLRHQNAYPEIYEKEALKNIKHTPNKKPSPNGQSSSINFFNKINAILYFAISCTILIIIVYIVKKRLNKFT